MRNNKINSTAKKPEINRGKIIRAVLGHIGKYMPHLIISIILAGAVVALTLYIPILVGGAVDLMVGAGEVDMDGILQILIKIGICAAGAGILQWLMNVINNRITYHVVRDVRAAAFRKIESLPLSYIDSRPVGGIVSRVVNDADQFADGLLLGFTQLFTGVMTIVGTLIFMITISPLITLAVALLTPISLFAARFIASRTYGMFREQSEIRGEQTAYVNEIIKNQKLIRAFGREEEMSGKFGKINESYRKSSLLAIFYSSLTNPVTRFVNGIVYAAVALGGALIALGGAITVGGLGSFLIYANQYTKPFNEISGVVAELQNALACAGRLFELIDEKSEVTDKNNEALPILVHGGVVFDNVSFSYRPDRRLIEHLSLNVPNGSRVAIVGPTGCGKTTLINLLMRFYDTDGGGILIDGKNIKEVTRHSLRSNFGMVLQETWLMAGTIRENIAMGKPGATDEEIEEAARAAHAHSFIRRLPEGYDTKIGEDGGSLSEGQKQLLCISRVMLCLPPMLILDEATSSIDTRTERKIQSAFETLMRGRTSFVVAHRLSTIKGADVILVMRDGKIVEQGRHAGLLARGGFYCELYNSQFAGAREEN